MPPDFGQLLASCIMPTANRRRFVPQAIRYFLAQDYPSKEPIIVDDGDEAVGDLVGPGRRQEKGRLRNFKAVAVFSNTHSLGYINGPRSEQFGRVQQRLFLHTTD